MVDGEEIDAGTYSIVLADLVSISVLFRYSSRASQQALITYNRSIRVMLQSFSQFPVWTI